MPRPDTRTAGVRAITSLQNERVKLIRSLEMRKARRETGLFAAEGAAVLVTAREAGWRPRMLAFLAGSAQSGVPRGLVAWGEAAGAECLEVSEAVLGKLAAKDNPQTMLGVFEQRWAPEPQAAAVAQDATWL
ncbi:MAG TPA: RNA methyltransferase, partial [Hyphomicrobiaceae bacterium]|nr:RNA methyltransferase [Hyphomicrobiaceae bacterium]